MFEVGPRYSKINYFYSKEIFIKDSLYNLLKLHIITPIEVDKKLVAQKGIKICSNLLEGNKVGFLLASNVRHLCMGTKQL